MAAEVGRSIVFANELAHFDSLAQPNGAQSARADCRQPRLNTDPSSIGVALQGAAEVRAVLTDRVDRC